jgi:hypothetical protein
MILGMFCFQVYFILQKYDEGEQLVPVKMFFECLRGAKFLMAVVVSPIIFLGIRSLITGISDSSLCCLISFQNGFFWITMFNAKIPKKAPQKISKIKELQSK